MSEISSRVTSRRRILTIGAGAAMTGVIWTGARAQNANRPIRLGAILNLSGGGASYGIGARQGIEMSVREINAAGGIRGRRIELDIVDDGSDPAQSVTAMYRLANDNVDCIVGGMGSANVLANMEVAERAGIPYIVIGASNPKITTNRNKWTFRVVQSDTLQAQQLAQLAIDKLKFKRVAIINDSNDYGVGNRDAFVAEFARLGQKAVDIESYLTNDKDFNPQLARISSFNPDALAIFGTLPAAPAIMDQARDLGIKARFISGGGLASENLMALAPESSQGTIASVYFSEAIDPEAAAWARRFEQEFKRAAQTPRPSLASWSYRAIHFILAPSLEKAGTDKDKLRDAIANWRGKVFGLPGAEQYFDKTGHLVQLVVWVEVKGKEFVLLPGAN